MIEYQFVGTGAHLRQEIKREWALGTLAAPTWFVHGGPITPQQANTFGLTPLSAREFLTHAETGLPIAGGKMLFTFQLAAGGLPANARKSGAVGRLWGYDANCYVFCAPAGTRYWSTRGLLTTGCEVAFPYIVESTDIVEHWAPSGAASGGTNFVKAPWNAAAVAW